MSLGILAKKNREINRVLLIPLSEIVSNPYQPRKHFDQESIIELSRSIASNGLLQPISVRRLETGEYELVAGERRTLAYRYLGREQIPAIVEEYTDQQSAVLAMIENLQRKDLNFFEEAAGIARLMEQLNLTQQQVSLKLGKAQSTVANKLRLLRYPADLQLKMLEAGLTERHARAMLRIDERGQLLQTVEYVIQNHLTVEQTEQYIERMHRQKEAAGRTRLFVVKDMRMFHNSIQKACSLMNMAGIPVNSQKKENDEYIEYTIVIPKAAVYQTKTDSKKELCETASAI